MTSASLLPRVVIYTAAYCGKYNKDLPASGGWSFVILFADNEQRHGAGTSDNTTRQEMELTATVRAFEALVGTFDVTLHTDSHYVATSFRNDLPRWVEKGWLSDNAFFHRVETQYARRPKRNGALTSTRLPRKERSVHPRVAHHLLWGRLAVLAASHAITWHRWTERSGFFEKQVIQLAEGDLRRIDDQRRRMDFRHA